MRGDGESYIAINILLIIFWEGGGNADQIVMLAIPPILLVPLCDVTIAGQARACEARNGFDIVEHRAALYGACHLFHDGDFPDFLACTVPLRG